MKNENLKILNDLQPDEKIKLWRYTSFSSLCEIIMYNHLPLINVGKFTDKSEGVILKEILCKLEGVNEKIVDFVMQIYRSSILVSSWHKSVNENAAMWDRYARNGEGVAIKTNAKKLLNCIEYHKSINENTNRKIYIGNETEDIMMDYTTEVTPGRCFIKEIEYTHIEPSNLEINESDLEKGYDILTFFYKMEDFKDEKEVRILYPVTPGIYSIIKNKDIDIGNIKIYGGTFAQQVFKSISENPYTFKFNIGSAYNLIEKIVISPYAHAEMIKTVQDVVNSSISDYEINIEESNRTNWV